MLIVQSKNEVTSKMQTGCLLTIYMCDSFCQLKKPILRRGSYMFLSREFGGRRRQLDKGTINTLSRRKVEKSISYRLNQFCSLRNAFLHKLLSKTNQRKQTNKSKKANRINALNRDTQHWSLITASRKLLTKH